MKITDLLKQPERNRMFNFIKTTWNPVIGCKHLCSYCWARKLAETKLNNHPKYKDGFIPKIIESEFNKKFKEEEFVFVSDMGDLFGDWVPKEWILKVLEHIKKFPKTPFLLLTKNPKRYFEFLNEIPSNCILGTTIETNLDKINGFSYSSISKAPLPSKRIEIMKELRKKWKNFTMIAIEPIMKFDNNFALELKEIMPTFIVIGKDNYNNNLPEPYDEEILELIKKLKQYKMKIILKGRIKWIENKLGLFAPKKLDIEKVKEFIEIVRILPNSFLIKNKVYNEFESWSLLKLFALYYIEGPYLRIVTSQLKRKHSEECSIIYIDMFAGSGVNKIDSNFFLGSPLLTIKIATKMKCYFDKLFFLEKEQNYVSALEKRIKELINIEKIKWIEGRYEIFPGDANKNIEKILKNLDKKIINCLIFIDPNKAEHQWQSVEKLLNLRGDVLITFQSLLIAKEIGKAKSSHHPITKEKKEELARCLGVSEEKLLELDDEEKVRKYYIQKVKSCKKFVDTIQVKSGKGYSYYLIFGSSRENPPWKPIITSVKRYIESATGKEMKQFINVLLGKQLSLNGLSQQKRLLEYLNTTK